MYAYMDYINLYIMHAYIAPGSGQRRKKYLHQMYIKIKNGAIRFFTVEITNLAKGYWFYPDDV